jgi:serine/threonine protein kinase
MSLDELRATGVISHDDPDDVFELVEIIASGAYGSVYKGGFFHTPLLCCLKAQKQQLVVVFFFFFFFFFQNSQQQQQQKGVDLKSGRELAVKIIAIEEDAALKDMMAEVAVFRKCSPHANVVEFVGCYEKEDELYIAMEFCAGGSSADVYSALEVRQTCAPDTPPCQ